LSVIHLLAWRAELTEAKADVALARLELAPVRREQPRGRPRAAWAIADELDWAKTYDAE
jgi:hypothetical protein